MTDLIFQLVRPPANDGLKLALEAAGLPASDLDEPSRAFFRLADTAGWIGYVGLEGTGSDLLLRSLVVLEDRRNKRFGVTLVTRAEHAARLDGAERLHLLTTGAASFFRRIGYLDADRAAAPISIEGSAQFTSLCPASAAYLVKELT